MDGLGTFFAMGGYAAFVWPAFAVTFIFMLVLFWRSRAALAASERDLKALEAVHRHAGQEGAVENGEEPLA